MATKKASTVRERNKDKSKQQLLQAVGKILRTRGYTALKVNDIAAEAGLDKKLIYKYFGGTDQLIDAYVRSQDFWSNVTPDEAPMELNDGGEAFSKLLLARQFDYVAGNKELQKILLWGLAEKRTSLKMLAREQEENGEALFAHIADPYFGDKATGFRATMAILISGIYYLNMYAGVNASTFCGINVASKEGKTQLKNALEKIITLVYEDQKNG